MPPVEFLSDAEFHALLETPYNPAPEYTPEFVEEHELPHAQMKRALDALDGEEYACAYSAMEDCWTTSRYVSAFLASPNFIRPDLFHRLYEIAASFSHDYVMHILSDFDLIPEFELLITKHRFVVRMSDRSQLHQIYNAAQVT
jgi:hypothetical protein